MAFLFILIAATFLACSLFYTQAVTVKMLPFDNKPEFNVVINMPDGTAMPVTANVTTQLAAKLRELPEVTSIQTYVGTASPFNFNGMVRHYYLRQEPWQADIQVMLLDKDDRERASHEIAVHARELIKDMATDLGADIQIIEMPPGPPVLQTVVAEIYGPDAETRRQVARDMTEIFKAAEGIVDVDNYMSTKHDYWRFEVDTEKAVRRGISVDAINRNLSMVMGGYKLGDVKKGVVLEPTYIVIQAPMGVRSQINRLGNLPVTGVNGETVPLSELGSFIKEEQDHLVYHKDLRDVEYVTGEMQGRLGAPIYGMFDVEDILKNYVTPDGVTMTGMPMGLLGPPDDSFESGFEWGGEWTVTYETFRDMGGAFMAAMLLIYGLIVWEFKNFTLGGLIMAPIPLTLIGIVPGHWFANAEFTATSMIGFIALAGIVVRNSILLVEFVKHEVANGVDIKEAVVLAGKARMRPILITALTLMAGAYMILDDLIFKGMAVSLLYGAGVATVLTLVVIPLGCISVSKQFYLLAGIDNPAVKVSEPEVPVYQLPLWLRIWMQIINVVTWTFYIGRMIVMMVRMGVQSLLARFGGDSGGSAPSSPDGNPGSSGGSPPPAPSSSSAASSNEAEESQSSSQASAQSQAVNDEVAQKVVSDAKVSKPVVKKKAALQKKVATENKITTVKKKPAPRKKVTPASEQAEDKKNTATVSEKKVSTKKKRRGIRLNPGLETE